MGTSTKPRKAHRAKPVHVPMMRTTRDDVALEVRMAIEALIGAPSPDTYNQLSKMLAALCYTKVESEGLDRATETLSLICDRFERVHKVGVSDAEAQALRAAGGGLDAMLAKVPMNKFRESVAIVTYHGMELGI